MFFINNVKIFILEKEDLKVYQNGRIYIYVKFDEYNQVSGYIIKRKNKKGAK